MTTWNMNLPWFANLESDSGSPYSLDILTKPTPLVRVSTMLCHPGQEAPWLTQKSFQIHPVCCHIVTSQNHQPEIAVLTTKRHPQNKKRMFEKLEKTNTWSLNPCI